MANSHQEEIAKLEALFSEHPEGRVFTHLAEAWRKAGDLDRARELLGRGLEHHPDYSSAHVVLGRVLLDMGDRPEAIREFRRVLELDAHNLVALRALGDTHRDLGEPGAALDYYRELAQLDPTNSVVDSLIQDLEAQLGTPVSGDEPTPGESAPGAPGSDEEVPDWDRALAAASGDGPVEEPIGEGDAGEVEPAGVEVGAWEPVDDPATAEALDLEAAVLETDRDPDPGTEEVVEHGADLPPLEPWAATDFDTGAAPLEELPRPVEAVGDGAGADEVATETMGDLYFQQGLYGRASGVYRRLLLTRPGDQRLMEKLERAERNMTPAPGLEGGGDRGPDPLEPPTPPASEERDLLEPWTSSSSGEGAPEPDPSTRSSPIDEHLESEPGLAAQGLEGRPPKGVEDEAVGGAPDSEIPYAPWSEAREEVDAAAWSLGEPWGEAPGERPGAGAGAAEDGASAPGEAAPTVSEYFSALLAWRPAAEPPWIDLDEPVVEAAEAPAERFPWEEGRGEAVSGPGEPPELDLAVAAELVEGGDEGAPPTAGPVEDAFPWEAQGGGGGAAEEAFPWEERQAPATADPGGGAAPAGDAAPPATALDARDEAFPWEEGATPTAEGPAREGHDRQPDAPPSPPDAREEAFPWEARAQPTQGPEAGSDSYATPARPGSEVGRAGARRHEERGVARPGAPQREPAPEEEDEEDLEMFRSWLQSLKR